MTRLSEAIKTMGLAAELALGGRLVKLQGEHCAVYVAEAPWAAGFYAWCDDPLAREVERFGDPVEAIRAGLARAREPSPDVGQPGAVETSDR